MASVSVSENDNLSEEEKKISEIEIPLLNISEVFVYRVPPLRASSGHRAEEWGLENPAFAGSLKIVRKNDLCYIQVFKSPNRAEFGAHPSLFCSCRITFRSGRQLHHFVENVMDSSRYFVLRCEDEINAGRVAYVGIGFRERNTAFDFKAVLDDFVRSDSRAQKANILSQQYASLDSDIQPDSNDGKLRQPDFSLKEGERIKLNLPVISSSKSKRSSELPKESKVFIPPPKSAANQVGNASDEWSDFTSASF